jgi:hypothetical protein
MQFFIRRGTCTGREAKNLYAAFSVSRPMGSEVAGECDIVAKEFELVEGFESEDDPFVGFDMDNQPNFQQPKSSTCETDHDRYKIEEPADTPNPLAEGSELVVDRAGSISESSMYKYVNGPVTLGAAAKPIHESHKLMFWGGYWYCGVCGSWAVDRTVNLHKVCSLKATEAGRLALLRIGRGLAPKAKLQVLQGGDSGHSLLSSSLNIRVLCASSGTPIFARKH